jgi:hypothetical protein
MMEREAFVVAARHLRTIELAETYRLACSLTSRARAAMEAVAPSSPERPTLEARYQAVLRLSACVRQALLEHASDGDPERPE